MKLLRLCNEMILTLKVLGRSPTARIDARLWAEYYAARVKRQSRTKSGKRLKVR